MQSIAQGWLLFDLTASPFYLGLFSSLRMVLLVSFFMLGGLMSDRLDRRAVMLWIQVISALTALAMALLVSFKLTPRTLARPSYGVCWTVSAISDDRKLSPPFFLFRLFTISLAARMSLCYRCSRRRY